MPRWPVIQERLIGVFCIIYVLYMYALGPAQRQHGTHEAAARPFHGSSRRDDVSLRAVATGGGLDGRPPPHCVLKWILRGHLKPTPSATI